MQDQLHHSPFSTARPDRLSEPGTPISTLDKIFNSVKPGTAVEDVRHIINQQTGGKSLKVLLDEFYNVRRQQSNSRA